MAKDTYRYFRIEAQELLQGLADGLLQLEKGADVEVVGRLLRQAHTFKGASRVVKRADIGDLAHRIEDLLSPHRVGGGPVDRRTIDEALQRLDEIRSLMRSLEPRSASVVSDAERLRADPGNEQTVRVAVRDLDAVLESALEARIAASSLGREAERLRQVRDQLGSVRDHLSKHRSGPTLERLELELEELSSALASSQRGLLDGVQQVFGELQELRALASDLRLVPAALLTSDLERAARDAARTLNKDVAMRFTGTDTHIDAHVLSGVHQALIHLVRNAVAHGIEEPSERARLGKTPTGRVEVRIERLRHRVSIVCQDDGRGLDWAHVKREAIGRGLIARDTASSMNDAALAQLLLRGGVSTSRTVTGISGRGVGLDAVRHQVEALKGEIALSSRPGEGTTVEMLVPLSLSAMPALALHIDRATVLLPLDSVKKTLRLSQVEVSRSAQGLRLVTEGEVIPFVRLSDVLKHQSNSRHSEQTGVVVAAGGSVAAIGVDRLGAARSVVVRTVPAHAAAESVVAGAAFNDDGIPELVLSPGALVRAASSSVPIEEARPSEPPEILVVDDSLTTRMLEQSILESAGYRVDLAASAEEALTKAERRTYALFIVDVEMPGMNGFEFVARTRNDPALRDTPSILVTSRAAPADKRRGKDAGARAYIVKSEFDQSELLESIRRLIG